MNVLQLIDSLNAGGAERVAVNFANALVSRVETSYLCATREEGVLKESLSKDVSYLFLEKKSTIDLRAIKKLSDFVKTNQINIVHAHGSSFFIATIIKILNPKLVLIWHDHYGKSEFLNDRPKIVLKWCSKLFDHTFSVNSKLENWNKKIIGIKSVSYIANFATKNGTKPLTKLKGNDTKRIVILANLRVQKDHINLLEAFKVVHQLHADWSLHLVGYYDEDAYYQSVKNFIQNNHLENHVFIYGSCSDTFNILNQSSIGVLASKSEGLPLALLEYGMAKLPVVATDVGDCNKVISNTNEGLLIPSENSKLLSDALLTYINDLDLRVQVAENLHLKVLSTFSEANAIRSLLNIYKSQKT